MLTVPTNRQLTLAAYKDLRWQALLTTEETRIIKWKPYVDSAGDPQTTIGVGMNIEGNLFWVFVKSCG